MTGYSKTICLFLVVLYTFSGCNSSNSGKANTKENAHKGEELFNSVGCILCHSVSGEARYGPTLNAILNTEVQVIRKGKERTVKIDREYILRSVKSPDYEKLLDFKARKMPKTELTPEEIEYITDYLISINEK